MAQRRVVRALRPEHANHVWSYDFVSAKTHDGRTVLAFLQAFPTPALIGTPLDEDFVQQAWTLVGRKVSKQRLLEDIYRTAHSSIGIPVEEGSEAVAMFRVVLGEMIRLCQLRDQLEQRAALHLKENADSNRLQQIPGIGPILALTILA